MVWYTIDHSRWFTSYVRKEFNGTQNLLLRTSYFPFYPIIEDGEKITVFPNNFWYLRNDNFIMVKNLKYSNGMQHITRTRIRTRTHSKYSKWVSEKEMWFVYNMYDRRNGNFVWVRVECYASERERERKWVWVRVYMKIGGEIFGCAYTRLLFFSFYFRTHVCGWIYTIIYWVRFWHITLCPSVKTLSLSISLALSPFPFSFFSFCRRKHWVALCIYTDTDTPTLHHSYTQ